MTSTLTLKALETFVDNTTMLEETLLLIRNLGCYDDNKVLCCLMFVFCYLVLSCAVLCCLTLSCVILCCLVLSYVCLLLSCVVLRSLVLSCFVLRFLMLSCIAYLRLVWPWLGLALAWLGFAKT